MKAVIYARYSCERQTEQSIEGQLRECNDFAAQQGITIIGNYIDRAVSGKYDNRDQFQKMIRDSAKGRFEAVIVYKTDRFARNRYDSAMYKAKLKKNGVKVLYAKEHIPEGPEGIILESMLEGMAEYYSAELSQKVIRGMHETALKCQSTGGNIPLGYKVGMEKKIVVDENTAHIVQQIFNWYAAGEKVKDICDKLNAMGAKTSYGRQFRGTSVNAILKNEKYIGVYKYGNIRTEGGVPELIDRETWDKVQKRLEENRIAPRRGAGKVDYLLSGKLYCGKCGKGMQGESGSGRNGTKYHYYACVGRKKYKTCDKQPAKKDWIENLVVQETINNILQPDQIDTIAKRCVAIQRSKIGKNDALKLLNKQLEETKKNISNIMAAIEQGIIAKNTKERLLELEAAQERIEAEIAEQKEVLPELTESQIKYLLLQYSRESEEQDEDYNKDIIDCFVSRVYLYDDKLIVTYNLMDDEGKDMKKSELEFALADKGLESCAIPCSDNIAIGSPSATKTEHIYYIDGTLVLLLRNMVYNNKR